MPNSQTRSSICFPHCTVLGPYAKCCLVPSSVQALPPHTSTQMPVHTQALSCTGPPAPLFLKFHRFPKWIQKYLSYLTITKKIICPFLNCPDYAFLDDSHILTALRGSCAEWNSSDWTSVRSLQDWESWWCQNVVATSHVFTQCIIMGNPKVQTGAMPKKLSSSLS